MEKQLENTLLTRITPINLQIFTSIIYVQIATLKKMIIELFSDIFSDKKMDKVVPET